MITYWRENGKEGLRAILASRLAPNMTMTLDLLARNAFLNRVNPMFAGSKSNFPSLAATDTFDPAIARAVWLGADYEPDPVDNPIFGLVSPSAVYTIKSQGTTSEWITRMQYAQPTALINYEAGSYEDVRFAKHSTMTLWGAGSVIHQTTITAAANQGDGAPDPAVAADRVDGVWEVGQAGATHGITVADPNGFALGDWVIMHRVRNAATAWDAQLNGVTWDAYQNTLRRIVKKSGSQIFFHKPILTEWFESVVSGLAHYGWMTKARPVHGCVFIKGPRGVVSGVLQPPQTYTPPPVDDAEAIFRFAWDWYGRYQIMYPERFETYFHAGPIRRLGEVVDL
jgi:hypothetical protein